MSDNGTKRLNVMRGRRGPSVPGIVSSKGGLKWGRGGPLQHPPATFCAQNADKCAIELVYGEAQLGGGADLWLLPRFHLPAILRVMCYVCINIELRRRRTCNYEWFAC
jgi:hypothetical protein